jgi:hypothetical protein
MGMNFPTTSVVGETYAPYGGPLYVWEGASWKRVELTALPRNRAINGSMQVSQQNGYTSSQVSGYCFAEMWNFHYIAGTLNVQRQNDTAGGFQRVAVSVATAKPTLAGGDYILVQTAVEGYRCADFAWGTPSALPIVVRFLAVTVGITGTFSLIIRNGANNRTFVAPFTLTSGVWTWVTIPVPADTGGTWPKDNTAAMYPAISLGSGATGPAGWNASNVTGCNGQSNFANSTSNQFFMTNFGMYLDPTGTGVAPPWEEQDYAAALRECQRYYEIVPVTFIPSGYTPWPYFGWGYQVQKRISPALNLKTGSLNGAALYVQALEPTWGCRHGPATTYTDASIASSARM